MTHRAAVALRAAFAETVVEETVFRGELTLVVDRARIRDVLRHLRDDPTCRFDVLIDLTAVDLRPSAPCFEVVYHLYSTAHNERARIKVRVPEDDTVVPSACEVWPAADWAEREVYDLFGITCTGHPDLRRILMPDDWEGHPLRKDYPLTEEPVAFEGHEPKLPSAIIPHSATERATGNPFGSFEESPGRRKKEDTAP
ncbi:MAG: NADH-quinone oxidoreductase subunit C [Armatimonadetes bacterium]|nr:NADH-quinone oxidoreductase subunit C [Armatimonadota bacterium]